LKGTKPEKKQPRKKLGELIVYTFLSEPYLRERERKLEARNEAITLSIAELEKKIQLKVHTSLTVATI